MIGFFYNTARLRGNIAKLYHIKMPTLQMNPKQLNILLADDDVDDCLFFKKVVKELHPNSNLTILSDGEQLMSYLFENSNQLADVLFLDLNMPRKNGFECLTEIKGDNTLKDFPVVMFSTSYPRDKNYEQNLINMLNKIGSFGFIRKHSDLKELKLEIQNVLMKITKSGPLNQQGERL